MQPSASSSPVKSAAPANYEDKIRHLPVAAQAAFRRYQATGEIVELDILVASILEDFIPKPPPQPLTEMPGATRLIDDLGFDSLAITEVVFFTEDLLHINIANDEILRVSTLDDLRAFVRRKVTTRKSA